MNRTEKQATAGEKQKIDELKKIIEELKKNLAAHEQGLRDKRLAVVKRIWGIDTGTVITVGDAEYKVSKINAWSVYADRKPGLRGYKRKKNGEWGRREVHIWGNWVVKV